MRAIQRAGRGVVVYLRHDAASSSVADPTEALLHAGRSHHGAAPSEQFFPATRDYGIGSQILRTLGLRKLRLLSNSQADYPLLESFGLEIVERVPVEG
jgi:3,4-dihydroxy 2-butanone 4-phosphate synthase / GTP cyclohydrolase II